MMHPVADLTRWHAVRLASRLGPARAARRLRVRVGDLAHVCAGWPVCPRVAAAVELSRLADAS